MEGGVKEGRKAVLVAAFFCAKYVKNDIYFAYVRKNP